MIGMLDAISSCMLGIERNHQTCLLIHLIPTTAVISPKRRCQKPQEMLQGWFPGFSSFLRFPRFHSLEGMRRVPKRFRVSGSATAWRIILWVAVFFLFFSSNSIVALLSEIHEQKLQDLLVRTSLSHSRKRSIRASPIVEHAYSATAV